MTADQAMTRVIGPSDVSTSYNLLPPMHNIFDDCVLEGEKRWWLGPSADVSSYAPPWPRFERSYKKTDPTKSITGDRRIFNISQCSRFVTARRLLLFFNKLLNPFVRSLSGSRFPTPSFLFSSLHLYTVGACCGSSPFPFCIFIHVSIRRSAGCPSSVQLQWSGAPTAPHAGLLEKGQGTLHNVCDLAYRS